MPTLMRQINIIGRSAGMYRTELLKDTDLNAGHTSYILSLCRHSEGISQEDLARHLCINRSNVTRQLAYLEEHGYIERRPCETDRRVMLVYPTDKAFDILPRVQRIVKEWNDYLTDGFSNDELNLLDRMIERLCKRARDYSIGKVVD